MADSAGRIEYVKGKEEAGMRLSVSYTKAINQRYGRVGGLFQGAFQSRHISRNEDLLNLSRYIYLNPVLAKMVKSPQEWEFSSYQDYIGERSGKLPQPGVILNQFQSPLDDTAFCQESQVEGENRLNGLLIDGHDPDLGGFHKPPRSQKIR